VGNVGRCHLGEKYESGKEKKEIGRKIGERGKVRA
jgi:hypothetical protein